MHIPVFAIFGFFVASAFFARAAYSYGQFRAYQEMRKSFRKMELAWRKEIADAADPIA